MQGHRVQGAAHAAPIAESLRQKDRMRFSDFIQLTTFRSPRGFSGKPEGGRYVDALLTVVQTINSYLSNYVLIVLLIGTGLFFTIRTRFVQVRCFGEGVKRFSARSPSKAASKKRHELVPGIGHRYCRCAGRRG